MIKKGKKFASLMLALMLVASGCGQTDTEVTDYGQSSGSDSETSVMEESAGKSISDMLGGEELSANKSFSIAGKSATVNVAYNAKGLDKLSVFKVDSITEENLKEEDIVKALLGDSATLLDGSSDKKFLAAKDGDSEEVIITNSWVLYHNNVKSNYFADSAPLEIDDPTVTVHNYEGTHNDIPYNLLVSYSKNYNELILSFFPKNPGDVVGNDKLDHIDHSYPDGHFYAYQHSILDYDLESMMSDRPNTCSMTADEVNETVKNVLKNDLYLDIPEVALNAYDDMQRVEIPEGKDPVRSEVIYYNNDSLDSTTLDGGVRDGYYVTVMTSLCDLSVISEVDYIDYAADDLSGGEIYINDSGVVGFNISSRYIFKETVTEGANLMNFDEAMDAFAKNAEANLTADDIELADETVKFESINLEYFPIPSADSANEYLLTPCWILEAENAKYQTIARVVISATDGSFVKVIHEKEE